MTKRTVLTTREQQPIIDMLKKCIIQQGDYFVYTDGHTDISVAALVGGRVNQNHVLRLRNELYGRSGPPRMPKFVPQPEPSPDVEEAKRRGVELIEGIIKRQDLIFERMAMIGESLGICTLDGTKPDPDNQKLDKIIDLLNKLLDLWGYSPKSKIDEAVNAAVHKKS